MKKIIVFDFYRTLFDPDTDELFESVPRVLTELKDKGFELNLVSHGSGREELESLGIESFFNQVVNTPEKSLEDFEKVIDSDVDRGKSFVVGDRVEFEIKIGNQLGLSTIWVKQGKFGLVEPSGDLEKPKFTVSSLEEILDIIR